MLKDGRCEPLRMKLGNSTCGKGGALIYADSHIAMGREWHRVHPRNERMRVSHQLKGLKQGIFTMVITNPVDEAHILIASSMGGRVVAKALRL